MISERLRFRPVTSKGNDMNLTIQDAVNRGYNLLACTTLALAGLAFGTVVFEESDLTDKVDDIGFLLIAGVAIVWYLVGRNRFKRSVLPIVLSSLAVAIQIVGLVLEHEDPASFGDNIGGIWLFVPLLGFLIVQFVINRRYQTLSAAAAPAAKSPPAPAQR